MYGDLEMLIKSLENRFRKKGKYNSQRDFQKKGIRIFEGERTSEAEHFEKTDAFTCERTSHTSELVGGENGG